MAVRNLNVVPEEGSFADPVEGVPKKKQLWIVGTKISSANFIEANEVLNSKQRKITYKFEEDFRKTISATRERAKQPIRDCCLNFHGIYICSDEAREFIEGICAGADVEMKALHPSLGARAYFAPLDLDEAFKGSLYLEIAESIKGTVFKTTFDRLEKILQRYPQGSEKALPVKTKESLQKMLDHLRKINVTQDKDIDEQIQKFKDQIEKEELSELASSLKAELKKSGTRWGNIEL